MKTALIIFAKRNNLAYSIEEVTEQEEGQEFVSQYNTDPKRFTVHQKEVSNDLFDELAQKCGSPDFRVLLTEETAPHTGDIDDIPTVNLYVKASKILKKSV